MKIKVCIVLFLFALSSCGKSKKEAEFAGNQIRMCIPSFKANLPPEKVIDYYSQVVMMQVYEGLVSLDQKDMKVRPQLAEKINVKRDGLIYEFTLRKNVYFHDFGDSRNDRLLKPEDVVYSVEKACKKDKNIDPTPAFSLAYQNTLKGANDFHNGKAKSISGLTINGNKVIFELERKDNNFLQKISSVLCAVQSKKLSQNTDVWYGTGSFVIRPENVSESIIHLTKNEDYYLTDKSGNALPYLDAVEFIINTKKLEQLVMFENKKIDLIIGLPTSKIAKMIEGRIQDFNAAPPKLILHNNPQLVSNYYQFNMQDFRFSDKRVRQAFNYAIEKKSIGQNILRNQYSELGYYGIVPPLTNLFRGYDFESVKKAAYTYDPEKARQLLAEAGYPNGEGFGPVNLRYNIDDRHSAIADNFSSQIKNVLNINVNIDGSSFDQLIEDTDLGKGDIFRGAWTADYPSVESFLNNYNGELVPKDNSKKSQINQTRYKNKSFDSYLLKAQNASSLAEKRKYFCLAEIEFMKDPPIIPIYYNGELQIAHSHIRNMYFNPLNQFIFREVYVKDWTKKEFLDYSKNKRN